VTLAEDPRLERGSPLARAWSAFRGAPAYPSDTADRRTISVVGLELPVRATIAVVAVTLLLLFDYSRTFIPRDIQDLGRTAVAARFVAFERFVLFGLVPLAIVLLVFRDRPSRYGLRLGDWRWGLPLAVVGAAAMTPVVLGLVADPSFAAYYARDAAPVPDLLVTYALDLSAAEFLFRGFGMFALIRAIGPLGLVVAQLPFVFGHLGKPEIELFSTLFGGAVYGWLDWRTGSILWSFLAHLYILTLVTWLAGRTVGVI
jgi:membrane protease YdiL (CAAX protease family)